MPLVAKEHSKAEKSLVDKRNNKWDDIPVCKLP